MPTQDEKTLDKKTYSYDEVLTASLDYFSGDTLAATTWINKYCLRIGDGKFFENTPDDMHHRMAKAFYGAESAYKPTNKKHQLSAYGQKRKPLDEKVIYRLFKNFKYVIPQGSVMAMLGNDESMSSLSNCVVIKAPIDSYGGILYTDQQLAQLCKRRCGVGFDISTLRPQGSAVKNAAGSSSGVVSFMERFSNTTTIDRNKGPVGTGLLVKHASDYLLAHACRSNNQHRQGRLRNPGYNGSDPLHRRACSNEANRLTHSHEIHVTGHASIASCTRSISPSCAITYALHSSSSK